MKFNKCLLKAFHVSVLMLFEVEGTQIYNVAFFKLCELVESVLQYLLFKTHIAQSENLC